MTSGASFVKFFSFWSRAQKQIGVSETGYKFSDERRFLCRWLLVGAIIRPMESRRQVETADSRMSVLLSLITEQLLMMSENNRSMNLSTCCICI